MKRIEDEDVRKAAEHPMTVRGLDRLLTTQRPVVIAHLRSIRRRHPNASPVDVINILERRYLAAVTTGGAGVGAAAFVPGVGTGVSLVLTGVETAGFLEATALFSQSLAEVHGVAVKDPDRARSITMGMMLGTSSRELLVSLAAQAAGTPVSRTKFWGDVIGRNVPQSLIGPLAEKIQRAFLHRFARNTATGAVGRLLPFGIGAVVGGTANHVLGRKVVKTSRGAFGTPPTKFPASIESIEKPKRTIKVRSEWVSDGKD
ncbi:MAG: hypothetical protein KF867_04080 [Cryobacterium sp.]|nr:hypothetical protein [Cryobacterium sp.]